MVLSTLFGEWRARLAGNNYGNFVVFQVSFKFLLFLSYFVKSSREPIKHNKDPGQVLQYSDNAFFRNKAANSGYSRAAQPNCSENRFIEKTNQYHTCCFGILHGMISRLSHLNLCLPLFKLFCKGGLPRGRCDKSSRAVFQNSTCDIDFFFQ